MNSLDYFTSMISNKNSNNNNNNNNNNNDKTDNILNNKFLHTKPVYTQEQLLCYYANAGIDINSLGLVRGLERYIFENNRKPIAKTLQGSIYSAIDIITGRRVVIKTAKKNLVERNICANGRSVCEDIRNEAQLLWNISSRNNSDAGFSKFVEFFQNDKHYFLVCEHCGIELLGYIRETHPFESRKASFIEQWKQYIQYHFRFMAKSINFLHNECGIAHCDLSLENMVIDDTICRIIDFGLAKQNPKFDLNNDNKSNIKHNKEWKSGAFIGKTLYESPEIRNLSKYSKQHRMNEIPLNEMYNPQSSDVWALGVMLFIMLVGAQPWHTAEKSDVTFDLIYNEKKIEYVLKRWESTDYVDKDALDLLKKIFVCEKERIDMIGIMNHSYVKNAPRSLSKSVDNDSQSQLESNVVRETNTKTKTKSAAPSSSIMNDCNHNNDKMKTSKSGKKNGHHNHNNNNNKEFGDSLIDMRLSSKISSDEYSIATVTPSVTPDAYDHESNSSTNAYDDRNIILQ